MHGNRTYGYRVSKAEPSISRKDKAFPIQLGKVNPGSLGIRGSAGVQGTVQVEAFPTAASKTPKTLQIRGGPLARGNSKHDDKKGDLIQRAWLPIHTLSCAQERVWIVSETSDQLKGPEQVCPYRSTSKWRAYTSPIEQHSQGTMVLVHEPGYCSGGGAFTGISQYNCGPRIPGNEGPVRLDVESQDLQQDPAEMGPCSHPD